MKKGECSVEAGFVWADLLTNLERASEHCSNVALCVIDMRTHDLNLHETLTLRTHADEFDSLYKQYARKYAL